MFEVKVSAAFSGAHKLRDYRGRCERLHGHNWKVEVAVGAERLDKTGMVIDFKLLKEKLARIVAKLDHAYLNELEPFAKSNPTSENIAAHIHSRLSSSLRGKRLVVNKVSVWETEASCATYVE